MRFKINSNFFNFSPELIIIPNGFWGFTSIWGRLGVASEKIAFISTQKANDVQRSYFKNSPRMMTTKFYTCLFGVGVMKNNFIYKVTDEAMSKLVKYGIPQYFLKYIREVVLRELPQDEKTPRKFSLDDLEFGFIIYLSCCAISFAAFLIEIFYWCVSSMWSFYKSINFIKKHVIRI